MTKQDLVQIFNLRDYTKCSNYAKYNWHAPNSNNQSITGSIIHSCYRDTAVLNKRTDWKTIRNRTYKEVFKESNKTTDTLYKQSIGILETLRTWYLENYRDVIGEAICNLSLQEVISGVEITANIDTVLINDNEITLVEFTELNNIDEILKDIGIRTKIYLLGKEKILVNKLLVIKATDKTVTCTKINIHNPVEWNYKTLQALGLILLSIKQKIYYPSPTSMCDNCKYKSICSW